MFTTGLHFALGDEIEAMRTSVRGFAPQKIAPRAAAIDRRNSFPSELWRELGELGVLGITADPVYGGSGMGYLAHCVAMGEVSRASAHSNLCVNQISRHGTALQKHAIALSSTEQRTPSSFRIFRTPRMSGGRFRAGCYLPITGLVRVVTRAAGEHVAKGEALIVIEAMNVAAGDQVQEGAELLALKGDGCSSVP